MIPDYINCKTNEEVCDYLVTRDCPTTCPHALSLGIGAMTQPPKRTMTKELIDKLFLEDMRDY